MKTKLLLSTIFALVSCMAFTVLADSKVYPGQMGVRHSSSDPVPILSGGGIFNPHRSRWLRLDLPVIHDVPNSRMLRGWVKVVDQNFNRDIRIWLKSRFKGASGRCAWGGGTSRAKTSWGADGCNKTLRFGAVGAFSNTQHYYFDCRIPPVYSGKKSGIISYQVKERGAE